MAQLGLNLKLDLPWYYELPILVLATPILILLLPLLLPLLIVREALCALGVLKYDFEKKNTR